MTTATEDAGPAGSDATARAGSPTRSGPATGAPPVLDVESIKVRFPLSGRARRGDHRWLVAVDGASFSVPKGETLALVGESGSGKTTVARTIVRLQDATEGRVILEGTDLTALRGEELRRHRKRFQMVFQDPYSSLDPRRTVGKTIAEPLVVHGLAKGASRDARVNDLLEQVGLDKSVAERRPHQFSGGQRQRVGIARALAVEPALLVCDEPVSALDVSIRAQVVNLLIDLQTSLGLTYLFIAHDLALVRQVATSVAVMYLGRIVEIGPARDVYEAARHPYTIALLSAVPVPDAIVERARRRIILQGDIPNPADPPSGCRFNPRCWLRERLGRPEACTTVDPTLVALDPASKHQVACHFPAEAAQTAALLDGA